MILAESLHGISEGVNVGDDQGMVAETENGSQIIMNRVNEVSQK